MPDILIKRNHETLAQLRKYQNSQPITEASLSESFLIGRTGMMLLSWDRCLAGGVP